MRKITGVGRELFRVVESEQGYAFISDMVDDMPDAHVVAIARGSLYHTRRTVRILEKFLEIHGHLNKKTAISGYVTAARRKMPL